MGTKGLTLMAHLRWVLKASHSDLVVFMNLESLVISTIMPFTVRAL